MPARRNISEWRFRRALYQRDIREILSYDTASQAPDKFDVASRKCISHTTQILKFIFRPVIDSDIYRIRHRGNNVGSHVWKICKPSHEIDDNAGAARASARRLFFTRNLKCAFVIARAPRDTWPFFTLFQQDSVRCVAMSDDKTVQEEDSSVICYVHFANLTRRNTADVDISAIEDAVRKNHECSRHECRNALICVCVFLFKNLKKSRGNVEELPIFA